MLGDHFMNEDFSNKMIENVRRNISEAFSRMEELLQNFLSRPGDIALPARLKEEVLKVRNFADFTGLEKTHEMAAALAVFFDGLVAGRKKIKRENTNLILVSIYCLV